MDVGHHDSVLAFIVGLTLADAKGDVVGVAIGDELETTTFYDLGHALVELELRGWVTLNPHSDVASFIFKTTHWRLGKVNYSHLMVVDAS